MGATIEMLLDQIGDPRHIDADARDDGAPSSYSLVNVLPTSAAGELSPDVIYVASPDGLPDQADALVGMTVAIAGSVGISTADNESCRTIILPDCTDRDLLANDLMKALRDLGEWQHWLELAVMGPDPLDTTIALLADKIGNPTLLIDGDGTLIARSFPSSSYRSDPIFSYIVSKGFVSTDTPMYDASMRKATSFDGYPEVKQPFSVRSPESDSTYWSALVSGAGNLFGTIVTAALDRPLTPGSLDLLEYARDVVAAAIAGGNLAMGASSGPDYCVERLLDHIYVDEGVIHSYLRRRGWKVDDEFFCIVFASETPGSRLGDTLIPAQLHSVLLNKAIVVGRNKAVVAIARTEDYPYNRDEVAARLGRFAETFSLQCGVSDTFRDFKELKRFYDSCLTAIEYGRGTEGERVSFFNTCAPKYLEEKLFELEVNEILLSGDVAKLREFDAETGSELLRTLAVYLECGQNASLAARRLFIHRNTLLYRLERIKSVSEIDLDEWSQDSDRLFYLLYSCRFLRSR